MPLARGAGDAHAGGDRRPRAGAGRTTGSGEGERMEAIWTLTLTGSLMALLVLLLRAPARPPPCPRGLSYALWLPVLLLPARAPAPAERAVSMPQRRARCSAWTAPWRRSRPRPLALAGWEAAQPQATAEPAEDAAAQEAPGRAAARCGPGTSACCWRACGQPARSGTAAGIACVNLRFAARGATLAQARGRGWNGAWAAALRAGCAACASTARARSLRRA